MKTEPTPTLAAVAPATTCYAFEVWHVLKPEWARTINARSRGKAKSQYLRDISESWDADYRDICCRKIGRPVTSERFRENAKYRGMPEVECGQRVKIGESCGVIVGHNASANFDVLFDDDAPKYAGLTLNCHPQSVEILGHNVRVMATPLARASVDRGVGVGPYKRTSRTKGLVGVAMHGLLVPLRFLPFLNGRG